MSDILQQLHKYRSEIQSVARKGFFYLFVANGLIYVIGFASQLFIAWILDPADIGRIKIMQTFIGLFSLIGGLGFNVSLLKLASEERSDEEKLQFLNFSTIISILSAGVLFLVCILLARTGLVSTDSEIVRLFPYYSFFLLPLVVQNTYVAFYQATKNIKKLAFIQFVVKVLTVALIIAATYWFGMMGYVLILTFTGVLSVIVLIAGLPGQYRRIAWRNFHPALFKPMWKLAGFALLANLAGTLLSTLDVYLINYFIKDRQEVGFYMFALTIVTIFSLIPQTIQQVAFPYFSEKSTDQKKWKNAYSKYNRLNHLIIPVITVGSIFVFPPLVGFAFSGKYDRSGFYFIFLALAWMMQYLNSMKGTALMGKGKFNINFFSAVANLLITSPILLYLIMNFGLTGVLISKIITGIICYLISWLFFYAYLKFRSNIPE